MKGRRRAAALTVLAVVAGLALPVLAAFVVAVDDPADTRGLLDVHQVRFDDASDGLPAWTVITFDEWTVRQIWDRGNVLLHLDTFGRADPDYYVLVRSDRNTLVATLWRDRETDRKLFKVPVSKRGSRGVEVEVPLRKLTIGTGRTFYRWYVTTLFTSNHCRQPCRRRAEHPPRARPRRPRGGPIGVPRTTRYRTARHRSKPLWEPACSGRPTFGEGDA